MLPRPRENGNYLWFYINWKVCSYICVSLTISLWIIAISPKFSHFFWNHLLKKFYLKKCTIIQNKNVFKKCFKHLGNSNIVSSGKCLIYFFSNTARLLCTSFSRLPRMRFSELRVKSGWWTKIWFSIFFLNLEKLLVLK